MEQDLYAVLGVGPDVDDDGLRRAWRQVARRTHPDVGGDRAEFEQAREAYEILTAPDRRRAYDRSRAAAAGQAGPSSGANDPLHSMVTLLMSLNRMERAVADLRQELDSASIETLVNDSARLADAETRLAALYAEFARQCEMLGVPMFDPRQAASGHGEHHAAATARTPSESALNGRVGTQTPRDVTAAWVFPDGSMLAYTSRNVHGVAVPDVAQAAKYNVGPRRILDAVRPDDPWLVVPPPMMTDADPRRFFVGPRWLRRRPVTAAALGTLSGFLTSAAVTHADAGSFAGRVGLANVAVAVVVFTIMWLSWPGRLVLVAVTRPTKRPLQAALLGAVSAAPVLVVAGWWSVPLVLAGTCIGVFATAAFDRIATIARKIRRDAQIVVRHTRRRWKNAIRSRRT
jgi:hypothetical protein